MKINLFEINIYIDNIDCSKINLQNENFKKNWPSQTQSSHSFQNKLDDDSQFYLINKIGILLKNQILKDFKISITSIWQNDYIKNDFQEKHIHPHSHFSFIIYKKVDESKTVFFNPAEKLIQSFYPEDLINKTNFFKLDFQTKCRENQMVLFPSFLEHMVKKNSNCSTISGNIVIEINQ
tara:strand:+ start:97 stop:633 length:537 start_codon:yes stop_codon:yes gene_type:complete